MAVSRTDALSLCLLTLLELLVLEQEAAGCVHILSRAHLDEPGVGVLHPVGELQRNTSGYNYTD